MMKKIILPLVAIAILILAGVIYIGINNLSKQESPAADNNTQAPAPAPLPLAVEGPNEASLPEDLGAPELTGEPVLPEEEVPLSPEEALIGIEDPISQEPTVPAWQVPDEPMQSAPLEQDEQPKNAIKISMSATGITPVSFSVQKGAEVTLSIISNDEFTHVFKFKSSSLSEVAVGLSPGETRAITFYAPSTKGDYEFYCDVPGHEARGETGIMTVK